MLGFKKAPLQRRERFTKQDAPTGAHHAVPRNPFSSRAHGHRAARAARTSAELHAFRQLAVGDDAPRRDFLHQAVNRIPGHREFPMPHDILSVLARRFHWFRPCEPWCSPAWCGKLQVGNAHLSKVRMRNSVERQRQVGLPELLRKAPRRSCVARVQVGSNEAADLRFAQAPGSVNCDLRRVAVGWVEREHDPRLL